MNLLIYVAPSNGVWERLRSVIPTTASSMKLDICHSLDALSHRLRSPSADFTAAILVASSYQELLDLVTFSDLLTDLRIIMILPDRNKNTIAKAHTLRPRFLTYLENGLNDVTAVLNKMLEKRNPEKTLERG